MSAPILTPNTIPGGMEILDNYPCNRYALYMSQNKLGTHKHRFHRDFSIGGPFSGRGYTCSCGKQEIRKGKKK